MCTLHYVLYNKKNPSTTATQSMMFFCLYKYLICLYCGQGVWLNGESGPSREQSWRKCGWSPAVSSRKLLFMYLSSISSWHCGTVENPQSPLHIRGSVAFVFDFVCTVNVCVSNCSLCAESGRNSSVRLCCTVQVWQQIGLAYADYSVITKGKLVCCWHADRSRQWVWWSQYRFKLYNESKLW